MEDIFMKLISQYPYKRHGLDNDLPLLRERIKIEKDERFVANLQDKSEYVIHIGNLNQASNHRLVLKKAHRVIKFNQNAWLKPYDDINSDLRIKTENDFEKVDE